MFLCGAVVDKNLYFSDKDFGGIFTYEFDTGMVKTEKNESEINRLYRSCIEYNRIIYFISQDGNYIDAYDINEKRFRSKMIGSEHESANISSIELYGSNLFLVPFNRDGKPYWIDTVSERLWEDSIVAEFMKDAPGDSKRVFSRCCIHNGFIYFGIYKTNNIMIYDVEAKSINVISTGIENIYSVYAGNAGIWVAGMDGSIEYIMDTGLVHRYNFEFNPSNASQWAYNAIAEVDGVAYLIPAYAESIIKVKGDKTQVIPFPKDIKKMGDSKFFSFCEYQNNLYLYPVGFDKMMILETSRDCLSCINMSIELGDSKSFNLYIDKNNGVIREEMARIDLKSYIQLV